MSRQMKDSGVEWIGQIPKEWEILKLRTLGNTKSGLANKKPEDFGRGYPFITYKNVYTNIILDKDYPDLVESTESDREIYNVLKGDAFFTGSSETIEELGFASMCLEDIPNATYNGFCIRFRPNSFEKYNPGYMKYCFRSEVARGYLTQHDNSITRANLSQKVLKNMLIVIPSPQEQQKIADYLDKQVSEIDNIITKTTFSIEEYKKYKQSLISETVTKGLNPNIEMKDSGVEWNRNIPKHWEVINGRRAFSQRKDKAFEGDKQLTASQKLGIVYQEDFMKSENQKVVLVEKDFSILKHVEPNDFVISMRSFQGGLEHSLLRGCISSAYVMIIPNDKVYAPYFRWLFKSVKYINALQSTSNLVRDGQAMRYLNFVQIPLFIFPKEEQKEIADFLDQKCAKIDNIITQKLQLLTELKNYKKSLIYECVTGKREVK